MEWIAAIALNLDYVLVGHFLGGASLGLYALAFKLPDTTLGAAGFVGSRVLLPAFMSLDRQRLGIAVLQALRWLTMLLAPAGAGLFVLAPVVVPLVFGEMWSEAVPVVQLLALSSCLNGLLQTVGAGFVAAGQPRKIIAAQVVWLALLVPSLYVTAQISIVAVACAHVLGMFVFGGVKLAFARSTLGLGALQVGRAAAPGLLATGAMVLVLVPMLRSAAPLPPLEVAAMGIGLGIATYVMALRILDPRAMHQVVDLLSPEHRRTIRRMQPSASPQRLAVTMLVQSYFPRVGGAETNLQSLIDPLRARGVDVTVLTRRFPGMAPGGQRVRRSRVSVCLSPDAHGGHRLRSPSRRSGCSSVNTGRWTSSMPTSCVHQP